MSSFQYHSASRYNTVTLYYTAVHYDRPHPNEYIIVERTTMHQSIMPNAYIVANVGCVLLVCAMDTGAILHIHLIAHFYVVHIAANNGIEPDATLITHLHIAGNGSVRSNETVGTEGGGDVIDRE